MTKSIEGIINKAEKTFESINEIHKAIERICKETKDTEQIKISVEDDCLNVDINVKDNRAYMQIALTDLCDRVIKSNTVNCYDKIIEIIEDGINNNIIQYANYVK